MAKKNEIIVKDVNIKTMTINAIIKGSNSTPLENPSKSMGLDSDCHSADARTGGEQRQESVEMSDKKMII